MAIIGHKAKFVELVPAHPSEVPANCMFIDYTQGNIPTYKDGLGNAANIGTTVPATDSLFLKQMQAEVPLLINTPLSKKSNGKVIPLDSDDLEANNFCGHARTAAVNADDLITVLCAGANVSGALSGLGFVPGQVIFIGETGQYVSQSDVSGFTGNNDTIIQVGLADCAAGTASGVATDLIVIPDVIAYP